MPNGLARIVMRLARNPGTEFADGDDHRGYTLTARGVKARLERLTGSGEAGPMLLDGARAIGAGILVAGAFGHPRLQEFIFGGTTRSLLNADQPSLFLSH